MATEELPARQQRFVDEYLRDLNGKAAAIRAGYAENSAEVTASKLLRKAKVREAVDAAKIKRSKRTGLTQDYVLGGIQDLVDRCIQAEPVRDKEGRETGEYQFEAQAALKGYELLGKHLKLFTEKREHSFPDLKNLSDEQLKEFAGALESEGNNAPGGSAGT